jgi:hypothetical protein
MPLSCQLQNSCVKFDTNKLNSLQRYDTAQNYRIPQSDSAFVQT